MDQLNDVVAAYISKNKLSRDTPGLGFQYRIGEYVEQEHYIGKENFFQDNSFLDQDSLFQICSITKVFVGILLLKLEEKKIFDLKLTIGDFYKEAPVLLQDINMSELVTHTSGLVDYLTSHQPDLGEDWQTHKALKLIWNLNSKPGPSRGKYQYSNTGFFLLGEIIQKLTGKKWFEALDEYVLNPLDIANTYSLEGHPNLESIIKAHELTHETWKTVSPTPSHCGWADGNLISNFNDLRKLSLVFESDVLFRKNYLNDKLNQRSVIVHEETYYSWGIQIIKKGGKTWLMHGGGSEGIHTLWIICPDTKEKILTYANHLLWTEENPHNNLNHTIIDYLGFKFK